jgi:hypothetical protein
MHNHVAVVNNDPAFARFPLFPAILAMPLVDSFHGGFREGIEHAVAGAGTQNEVIGKGCDVFYIEQENVLAFFFFERVDDRMSQFKCVQKSPRKDQDLRRRGRQSVSGIRDYSAYEGA